MRRFVLFWFLAVLPLVPAAADPLSVTGTVLAPDNRPAAGVRIELRTLSGSATATAETDAAGRFALEAPSAGIWRVVVRSSPPLQSPPLPLVEPLEVPPVWAALQPESPAPPQ